MFPVETLLSLVGTATFSRGRTLLEGGEYRDDWSVSYQPLPGCPAHPGLGFVGLTPADAAAAALRWIGRNSSA